MQKNHDNDSMLCVLEVLKKYSDENHMLTQKDINDLVIKEYGEIVHRDTIRSIILKLVDFGIPIHYSSTKRGMTDLYYEHDFTDGELRMLINCVLFTDGLSQKYRNGLIDKLERLTSNYFRSVIRKIDINVYDNIENKEIFLTIENINEAILEGMQISFVKTDNNKPYEVSPYQLVSCNGHQYLLCHYPSPNPNRKGPISHFRIDRLKESQVLKKPLKQLRNFKGYESGIQLCNYVKEHPNMWGGDVIPVTFKCDKDLENLLKEEFGTTIKIEEFDDKSLLVHVNACEESMFHWGMQYMNKAEIIKPKKLRERIQEVTKSAFAKYNE